MRAAALMFTIGLVPAAAAAQNTVPATGGDINAPWEWGPAAYDERHRVTVAGVFKVPFGFDVSPSMTAATARPYTQINGANPSGDGSLFVKNPDGTPADRVVSPSAAGRNCVTATFVPP